MAGDLTENFSLSEFAQRDPYRPVPAQYHANALRLARQLQPLRDVVGRIVITSSYRTLAHNTEIGGATSSQHLTAKAADFTVPGMSNKKVYCTILALIPKDMERGGLGWYGEKTANRVPHLHYDVGGFNRRWNKSGGPLPVCPPVAEEEDMAALDDYKKAQAAQRKVAGWFLIAAGYAVAGGKLPKWLRDKLKYVLA